jgi:hypothetical protein
MAGLKNLKLKPKKRCINRADRDREIFLMGMRI